MRLLENGDRRILEVGGYRLLEVGTPAPVTPPGDSGWDGREIRAQVRRHLVYARLRARRPIHRGRATLTIIHTGRAVLTNSDARALARACFHHTIRGALYAPPARAPGRACFRHTIHLALRAPSARAPSRAYASRGRSELLLLTSLLD